MRENCISFLGHGANCHKFNNVSQHLYYIIASVGKLYTLQGCNPRVGHSSVLMWILSWPWICFWAHWGRCRICCKTEWGVKAALSSKGPAMWPSHRMAVCFFKARVRVIQSLLYCTTITEVASRQLYRSLLFESESQLLPTFKGTLVISVHHSDAFTVACQGDWGLFLDLCSILLVVILFEGTSLLELMQLLFRSLVWQLIIYYIF